MSSSYAKNRVYADICNYLHVVFYTLTATTRLDNLKCLLHDLWFQIGFLPPYQRQILQKLILITISFRICLCSVAKFCLSANKWSVFYLAYNHFVTSSCLIRHGILDHTDTFTQMPQFQCNEQAAVTKQWMTSSFYKFKHCCCWIKIRYQS